MTNQKILADLRQQIIEDNVCSSLASTANSLVFGAGDENSDVVFIGEAPGKKEDESGLPFVGATGKFLDEMLDSISLKRSAIYLTNIVKYRPPNNRDPLPAEKEEFWPYLLEQIRAVKPRLLVTLGRHSGQAFIPDLTISEDHGQARTVKLSATSKHDEELEVTVLPLYHPAAALYNGGLRETLLNDFKLIKEYI